MSLRRIARLAALAAVCAGGVPVDPAHAQPAPVLLPAVQGFREPLVTDRPNFTESPSVVGTRRLQLEAGHTFARSGGVTSSALGEVLLRLGVASRAELRVALNSYVRTGPVPGVAERGPAGWEDASIGAKLALVPEARGGVPALALLVGTSVPTGSAGLRREAPEPAAKLALAWDLGERWAVSSNLKYALRAAPGGARVGEPSASLSLGRALTPRLGSYLEAFAFRPRGAEGTEYVNGGVTALLSTDLQLDARVGSGIGRNGRDYFVGLGLARRW